MADELEQKDSFFGQSSSEHLDELNKALGTGTDGDAYGNGAYADMSAIRPQSLEGTLKYVTAQQKHIKFWKTIGKKKAFNTVEEFNVLDSYGGDSSPFFVEGGLPNEEDSNFVRQSGMVKFLGTTRSITHPAQLVRNTIGDIVAQQTEAGTLWLLTQLEKQLYFANSALDPLAFDGVITQVKNFVQGKDYENQHIIDLRGNPLDEFTLEDTATIIADNFGNPTLEMHLTNQVHKDMSKIVIGTTNSSGNYNGRQRIDGMDGSGISLGQPVRDYHANVATINFVNNIFLKPQDKARAVSQKGAPAIPTITGVGTPVDGVADATSKLPAGTYHYFVSAKNSTGESAPVYAGSAATTSGERADIIINRVVSDPVAVSYKLYRGVTSNVADAQFAFEVRDIGGAATTQTIADRNFDIPGTHTAVLIDNDPDQVLAFKQLAPLMKKPLAAISASDRFMLLLYGMVQVYNPRRIVVIKNIGTLGLNSNRPLWGNQYGATSFGTVKPVAR